MAGLAAALAPGSLIGIDTSPFIYALEAHPRYRALVEALFLEVARGTITAVTSVLTIMEVAVQPHQLGRPEVADAYEAYLCNYPNLTVRDVDREVARLAAMLRARHRLRPPDSLHVATALAAGVSAFLTNDRGLRRVTEVPIVLLDDLLTAEP